MAYKPELWDEAKTNCKANIVRSEMRIKMKAFDKNYKIYTCEGDQRTHLYYKKWRRRYGADEY